MPRDGHQSPIKEQAAPIYDRSSHISWMAIDFHDLIESRAMAYLLAHRPAHVVLKHQPNRVRPGNWPADPPTQGESLDSGERRSLLSFEQQRRLFRLCSLAPRALV